MNSEKQKSGLTIEEYKLSEVLSNLIDWFETNKKPNTDTLLAKGECNVRITRYDLRQLIEKTYYQRYQKAPDIRVTWKFINTLLYGEFIQQNPTSHKHYHPDTNTEIIKPTNDTKYFINPFNINNKLTEFKQKINEFNRKKCVCLTESKSLDSYLSNPS